MQIILARLWAVAVLSLILVSGALASEWINLFDSETTKGWTPRSQVIRFEAKDGVLELDSRTNCWVTTDVAMGDFEAELEVLLPDDAKQESVNSGFAYRCIMHSLWTC